MKYIKTFENYSVNEEEIFNKLVSGAAKLINKASAKDYNIEEYQKNKAKDLAEAAMKHLDATYEGGKITKYLPARNQLINGWRETIKKVGVPDELIDTALCIAAMYSKGQPIISSDKEAAIKLGKGSFLEYNKDTKMLKFTPVGEGVVNPNG